MGNTLLSPEELSARKVSGVYQEISTDLIRPNAANPRRRFDPIALQDLVDSISFIGIMEPLVVRLVDEDGEAYEVIAGERRLRAAKMAELDTVPCIIRQASDKEALEMALIENLIRQDINPVEEAEAFRTLASLGRSQVEIAGRIRKSQSYISSTMKLLDLPFSVQELLQDNRLTRSHGEALCSLIDAPEALVEFARMTIERGWGSRFLEDAIRKDRAEREGRIHPPLSGTEPEPTSEPQASAAPSPASALATTLQSPDTSNLLRSQSPPVPQTPPTQASAPTSAPEVPAAPAPSSGAPTSAAAPAPKLDLAAPISGMVTCIIPVALDDWLYESGFDTPTQALELFRLLADVAERKGVNIKAYINTLVEEN